MKKLALFIALNVVSASVAIADVTGTWDLSATSSCGPSSTNYCNLLENGSEISGTCGGDSNWRVWGHIVTSTGPNQNRLIDLHVMLGGYQSINIITINDTDSQMNGYWMDNAACSGTVTYTKR